MKRSALLCLVLLCGCEPDVSIRVTTPRAVWPATDLIPARAVVEVRENDELFEGEVELTTSLGGFGPERTKTTTLSIDEGRGAAELFVREPGSARIHAELGIFSATSSIAFVDPAWTLDLFTGTPTVGRPVPIRIDVTSALVADFDGLPVTVGTDFGYFPTPDGGTDTQTRSVPLGPTGSATVSLVVREPDDAVVTAAFDDLETSAIVRFE